MEPDPSIFAHELVARFRRQKPVRAGSLIVTLFGDSIAPRGGAIALGSLIRLAAPFGLNERLVRTATTRLAQEGWLSSRRLGRLSEYHLSDDGRQRFADATHRIYAMEPRPWSGRWTLICLPTLPSAQRQGLKRELTWHGFGEIKSGVFAHPAIAHGTLQPQTWETPLPTDALIFDADLAPEQNPQRLVEAGWNLKDLGLRYQRFVQRYERAVMSLSKKTLHPEPAFLIRSLLIHEYRRLHLRDPLLPSQLLPADWPGLRAAQMCQDIYRRVFEPSEVYLSSVAAQLEGPLAPPSVAAKQRFGGLEMRNS